MPLAPLAHRHPGLAALTCCVVDCEGHNGYGQRVFTGRYEECIRYLGANARNISRLDVFRVKADGSLGRPMSSCY